MSYENILFEKKDGIATVTFNRPKVLNALNRKTVQELRSALLDARDDEAVRVLILTGAGEKAFVAGADIGELSQQTPVNGKDFSLFGQGVFHLLETMGKPSICAINGFALGGGCELALTCSIRIASKTARLGQPEVKLGILARIRWVAAPDAFVRQRHGARIVPDRRNDQRRRSSAHRPSKSHL